MLGIFIEKNENFNKNEIVIKLAADGAISQSQFLKFINICFTNLEDKNCKSAKGNKRLAILKCSEKVDDLREPFSYLMKAINHYTTFNHKEKSYKIIYKWGSDWMILCKLLGINGPNSDYPCLLCACHKNDLGNWLIHKKNMVDNATTYVRTNKLQNETLANKKAKKNGYIYESILGIAPSECVFDTLHISHIHIRYSPYVIKSFKHTGQFEMELNDSMRSLESSDDSSDDEIIIDNDDDDDQYYCTYCKGNFNKHNHQNSELHKYNLGKRETVYNFNGFFSVDVQQRNALLDNEGWLSNAVIECYLLCILPTKSHILRKF